MSLRKSGLSPGWYPRGKEEVDKTIKKWIDDINPKRDGISAIVPHAGWAFSGRTAALTMVRMREKFDTLVIAGGHLSPGDPFRIAREDSFALPGGTVKNNLSLAEFLREKLDCRDEGPGDNTVEVQLPLVNFFWKGIRILWIRVPPDINSLKFGGLLKTWSGTSGETLGVIGSTDLTHYGPSYGFLPMGTGQKARDWVRQENDGKIIKAMMEGDAEAVLDLGTRTKAACSAGAAAAAMEYARLRNRMEGDLVEYTTSYKVHPSDSFVGYAGVVF